jgi:hypothetical protein
LFIFANLLLLSLVANIYCHLDWLNDWLIDFNQRFMLMHYTEIWCISYGTLLVFANGLLCRRFYSICKSYTTCTRSQKKSINPWPWPYSFRQPTFRAFTFCSFQDFKRFNHFANSFF